MSKRLATVVVALFAAATPFLSALAQGHHDGRWVVDFAQTGSMPRGAESNCPAMRLVINIQNNQLQATLERERSELGEVRNSRGPAAEAVQGNVGPDGAVAATWENYHITGKLNPDNTGVVSLTGQCGPRSGHAVRVVPQH